MFSLVSSKFLAMRNIVLYSVAYIVTKIKLVFERKFHSYIASENLLIRFGKGNLPCLQCKVKALAMPSF